MEILFFELFCYVSTFGFFVAFYVLLLLFFSFYHSVLGSAQRRSELGLDPTLFEDMTALELRRAILNKLMSIRTEPFYSKWEDEGLLQSLTKPGGEGHYVNYKDFIQTHWNLGKEMQAEGPIIHACAEFLERDLLIIATTGHATFIPCKYTYNKDTGSVRPDVSVHPPVLLGLRTERFGGDGHYVDLRPKAHVDQQFKEVIKQCIQRDYNQTSGDEAQVPTRGNEARPGTAADQREEYQKGQR